MIRRHPTRNRFPAAAVMLMVVALITLIIPIPGLATELSSSAEVSFEAAIGAPFSIDWDTGFDPGGSPLKVRFYFYASSGEVATIYGGDLIAAWDSASAIPGRTLAVTVSAAGRRNISSWESDGGIRYGGRYKYDVDVGFRNFKREDYIPLLPNTDWSWPCDTDFVPFLLDDMEAVCGLSLGARGFCLGPSSLFDGVADDCVEEFDPDDFELNEEYDWCHDYPQTAGGSEGNQADLEVEVTLRPQPVTARKIGAKFGLCLQLLTGGDRLIDTNTSQQIAGDDEVFNYSIPIPCEFASAAPDGSREFTITEGPYSLEASFDLGFVVRVNPTIGACIMEAVEAKISPNVGVCYEVPVTIPLADFDFNEMEADFTIRIVDPEVRDIMPSGGVAVFDGVVPVNITWDTSWDAPDSCGCLAKVYYRLPDVPPHAWLPINVMQPQGNTGTADWYPSGVCMRAQIRVEMYDPDGRFLHAAEGAPFRVVPSSPELIPQAPTPGSYVCPWHTTVIMWEFNDPCPPMWPTFIDLDLAYGDDRRRTIVHQMPGEMNDFIWDVPGDVETDPDAEIVITVYDDLNTLAETRIPVGVSQPVTTAYGQPEAYPVSQEQPAVFEAFAEETSLPEWVCDAEYGDYTMEFIYLPGVPWQPWAHCLDFWDGQPQTQCGIVYPLGFAGPGDFATFSLAVVPGAGAPQLGKSTLPDTIVARLVKDGMPPMAAYDTILVMPDSVVATWVEDLPAPSRLALGPVWPNPFNPSISVAFALAEPGAVHLAVYDVKGRLVRTLARSHLAAGHYLEIWDGRDDSGCEMSSGVYFVQLDFDQEVKTRKVVLLE